MMMMVMVSSSGWCDRERLSHSCRNSCPMHLSSDDDENGDADDDADDDDTDDENDENDDDDTS